MQLSISIQNANVVRRGLENLAKEIPDIGRLQIYETAQEIVRQMKVYPVRPRAVPPTYLFQRSWSITRKPNGYTIENTAQAKGIRYPKYVVGDAYGTGQAWMHVGIWQKFRDINDKEVAKLPAAIDKNISQVARREGL